MRGFRPAFSNAAIVAAFLTGCSFDPTPTANLAVRSDGPVQSNGTYVPAAAANATTDTAASNNLINLFQYSYDQSIAAPNDADKAKGFYLSGIALIKTNCQEFFTRVGETRQGLDFGESTVATGGAAAIGILGITGASANTLALIGAGIASLLGISENYSNAYLFSPDTQAVQQLVVRAQGAYLAEADKAPPQDFYRAHGYLQGLQNLCEVHAIKKLVNEAVLAGTVTASTSGQAAVDQLADLGRTQTIERIVGTAPLTRRQLAALYWYLVIGTDTDQEAGLLRAELKGLKHGPFTATGEPNAKFSGDDARGLAESLSALSGPVQAGLRAQIESWRAELKGVPADHSSDDKGIGNNSITVTVKSNE